MTTNFPAGLDAFTNPSATDAMDSATVPHAAQHANLNDAVEALQAKVGVDGSAVTTSLDYQVANQGLVFIKSVAIGSGVSSVTVADVFSSTYDNYKIVVGGGVATQAVNISMQMGSTTTGYYSGVYRLIYSNGGESNAVQSNESNWYRTGAASTTGMMMNIELLSPNLATRTIVSNPYVLPDSAHTAGFFGGFLDTSTQYTSFTIFPNAGTITGGTIRVYGYNNG